jgi:hypothetical protein
VLHVSPLVRELMAALATCPIRAHRPRDALLGDLLLEELQALARCRITLAEDADATHLRACCVHRRSAPRWKPGPQHALTPKTLHRRFLKSTGMNWGRWYQQMRLDGFHPPVAAGHAHHDRGAGKRL